MRLLGYSVDMFSHDASPLRKAFIVDECHRYDREHCASSRKMGKTTNASRQSTVPEEVSFTII